MEESSSKIIQDVVDVQSKQEWPELGCTPKDPKTPLEKPPTDLSSDEDEAPYDSIFGANLSGKVRKKLARNVLNLGALISEHPSMFISPVYHVLSQQTLKKLAATKIATVSGKKREDGKKKKSRLKKNILKWREQSKNKAPESVVEALQELNIKEKEPEAASELQATVDASETINTPQTVQKDPSCHSRIFRPCVLQFPSKTSLKQFFVLDIATILPRKTSVISQFP